MKKIALIVGTSLALSLAPTANSAAPAFCTTTSVRETSTCAFQGVGQSGRYSIAAQHWAIYHYETVDGEPVRIDDLFSDGNAIFGNTSGTHVWQNGKVYRLEVTTGRGAAGNFSPATCARVPDGSPICITE